MTLAVAGLPEGIELSGNTIAGNKNDTELVLKVPEDAKVVLAPLTISDETFARGLDIVAEAFETVLRAPARVAAE